MNEYKMIPIKLLISVIVPLMAVTLGGFIVYQTPSAFFFPSANQVTGESNGPAVIYYALTLVIALMFFLMRQGYKWYEFITIGVLSVVYSLSLKGLTPQVFRPIYIYLVPLLVFFGVSWLIMKYIFLNKHLRQARLILFAILCSAAFTFAFWLQYIMLRQQMADSFIQSRFVSGLMLFIFMGVGLSQADFFIIRLEQKPKEIKPITLESLSKKDWDDDLEDK
jgi:hypothetical protein